MLIKTLLKEFSIASDIVNLFPNCGIYTQLEDGGRKNVVEGYWV